MRSEVVTAVPMKSAADFRYAVVLAACLLCLRVNPEDRGCTFLQTSVNLCQVTRCQITGDIILQILNLSLSQKAGHTDNN
jgi:hypothetical protein